MTSPFPTERSDDIWRLFNEIAELDPEARTARLDQACQDDPDLHREVASLLEAHAQADAVLDAYEQLLPAPRIADETPREETRPDPHRLVGQTVSHYQIQAYIGGGGMGVVYRAEDTRLQRPVALKFLPPELTRDPEATARFLHEAQAAAALEHANICTVHEIGQTESSRTFIAMAFYAGETLKTKIKRGALPVEEALGYAIQMAEGLERAHEAGIVHRDVKPANIMVTERGRVKIVDFGLAKVARQTQMTQAGTTLGTVSYMSPEQARGEAVDARTDVWSLGVVLYEMLTGQRPFQGDHTEAIIYGIRHDAPRSVRALRPEVPEALERIVEKALAKQPEERYQRAEDMLADLKLLRGKREAGQAEAGRTGAASPGRRRAVFYGIVATLVLVLAGLGYLLGWLGPEVSSTPVPLEARPAIAVLPLENRSGEEEQAYYADGMTDELTAVLTKINGLRVVPRQSVMDFKVPGQPLTELAQRLQVGYFVDGSMLWAGDEVRITLNLIDPATETALWGRSFVGAQRDVLALQQEVARAMVQQVAVQITPEDEARLGPAREVNPRAYELLRQGQLVKARSENLAVGVHRAIPYLEQAIAIDSTYASAYAKLGSAYLLMELFNVLPSEEALPKAEWHLEKAMELDDTLPEAYMARGLFLERARNWAEAEEALRHVIELNPGHPGPYSELGLLMFRTGRPEEGLELATYALGLDPVYSFAHQVKVQAQIYLRRYDEAIVASRKLLDLYPGYWIGYWGLGRAYLEKGLHEEALAVFEEMVAADSNMIGNLGYAYAVMGRRDEAVKILVELKARRADLRDEYDHISRIHAALGEREQALDWLEQHGNSLDVLQADPAFDPLRSEPRFQALLKKRGLDA